jgi:hypothetical protein
LVQGQSKRNTPIDQAKPAIRHPFAILLSLEYDLFDRNGEPPDQPRNLFQPFGIVNFHGSCEPNQAFVIAHRGKVARDDRRHRAEQIGQDVGHSVTSGEARQRQASAVNASFWRSVRAGHRRIAHLLRARRTTNHCRAGCFSALPMPRHNGLFGPLQALEPLLYAAAREPLWGFACSSVAQR